MTQQQRLQPLIAVTGLLILQKRPIFRSLSDFRIYSGDRAVLSTVTQQKPVMIFAARDFERSLFCCRGYFIGVIANLSPNPDSMSLFFFFYRGTLEL